MKTAAEIIAYLEMELEEAYYMYDLTKGKETAKAFAYMMKATTIEHLLDNIKQDN